MCIRDRLSGEPEIWARFVPDLPSRSPTLGETFVLGHAFDGATVAWTGLPAGSGYRLFARHLDLYRVFPLHEDWSVLHAPTLSPKPRRAQCPASATLQISAGESVQAIATFRRTGSLSVRLDGLGASRAGIELRHLPSDEENQGRDRQYKLPFSPALP